MRPLSRALRLLTLLLAAMQFAVPAVVSMADGVSAYAGRKVVAHVEPTGGNNCAPSHSPDCVCCRFLSTVFGVNDASAATEVVADATPRIDTVVVTHATTTRQGLHSRAPPALLG